MVLKGLLRIPGLGGCFWRGDNLLLGEHCFDEFFWFEWFYVVGGFAYADEFYWYAKFLADGDDDSTACGSVEFGKEYSGDFYSFCEDFCLVDCVLSYGRVEYEYDFVGCFWEAFLDYVTDFCELAHQVFLGVEASSGVDE